MRNSSIISGLFQLILVLAVIPTAVFSQIKIVSPTPRAVYQREVFGEREVNISGTFDVLIDKIEVRAVPAVAGQGIEAPWKDLQLNPTGGVFSGTIKLFAGWYTVEVRGTKGGNVVARDVLERLGVGEIFIIAGQSNAQGLKKYPGPGAQDDRVVYIENWVNDAVDKLTDPPRANFAKLETGTDFLGPRGQTPWCWGILGDMLVQRLNMPVLFINTAWEGTAVENWQKSADGLPSRNYYGDFEYTAQMPFANLRIAAKTYGNQYGVRAILWMQGEADAMANTPAQEYRNRLQFVINKLADVTSKRITWVIARTSRTSLTNTPAGSFVNASIIGAQNAVIDQQFNPTYPGPETDNLYINRADGTHFVGPEGNTQETTKALTILANAWNQSLDNNFFSTVLPVGPFGPPALTASCVAGNDAVSISLPEGYNAYLWNNGETTRTIRVTKAGTYFATVKDMWNNSLITSTVTLANDAKPATPAIIPVGQQQACADQGFNFSTSGKDIYSWYKEGSATAVASGNVANIKESGNYTLKAQNIFGCVSEASAPSSLTVRPKIPKPVIESSGPFTITATVGGDIQNEKYSWKRPGIEQDTIADIIKVRKTGLYSTVAQVTYPLGSNLLTCYSDSASRNFTTVEENDVVFFPNPSVEDYIYVESRDDIVNAEVTFYDMLGRELVRQTIPFLNSRVPFRIKSLAAGKYFVRIKGNGVTLTKHIVVR